MYKCMFTLRVTGWVGKVDGISHTGTTGTETEL